ncbi:hypothetical protein [Actinocatenispora rupis]|uniref:Uncharacterized protein n=1 Tax=Actinocatenispora rupis TaxID=519421 RepID=A0A8J3J8T8_9ACTN|nr:hypothetical protein [Actinocatenispora rupis]GID11503.1 hypothetical protein Aru02nite_23920 [Actinocatenispora rupis]
MSIVAPGDLARIGSETFEVSETYLSGDNQAEVTATDGRTFRTPLQFIRYAGRSRSRKGQTMGAHSSGAIRSMTIPAELRGREVRDGYDTVIGAEPHVGEWAWLTPSALVRGGRPSAWLYVERVESAYAPEHLYLHGSYVDTGRHARVLVDVNRLRVERAVPGPR